jgi:amino acid permease
MIRLLFYYIVLFSGLLSPTMERTSKEKEKVKQTVINEYYYMKARKIALLKKIFNIFHVLFIYTIVM